MGPCFWPSLGEGKRRSCRAGCLPPESCVSSRGELFTVALGAGPGMKPQMNSSCSGRSWLKQTAPSTGRPLLGGPELLEPSLEQEGCGASLGSCRAQGTTRAIEVPIWEQWPRLLPRGWDTPVTPRCFRPVCAPTIPVFPSHPSSFPPENGAGTSPSEQGRCSLCHGGAGTRGGSTQPRPWLRCLLALGMLDSLFPGLG